MARTEYLDGGHVVQFYGHEEELSDRVAGYLLGALRAGGAYDVEFHAAWENGRAFFMAGEGLRGRQPVVVEWKGSVRSAGDEVAPVDLLTPGASETVGKSAARACQAVARAARYCASAWATDWLETATCSSSGSRSRPPTWAAPSRR